MNKEQKIIYAKRAGDALQNYIESAARRANVEMKKGDGTVHPDTYAEAAVTGILDGVLLTYQAKVNAALRRGGIEVEEGSVVTTEALLQLICQITELEIAHWTQEEIKAGVMKFINTRVSDYIGYPVDLQGDLKQQAINAAISAVATGRANRILNAARLSKLKYIAVMVALNLPLDTKRKITVRIAQRRWRKTHKQKWQ